MRELLEKWCQDEGLFYLGTVDLNYKKDFKSFLDWRDLGLHGGLKFLERYDDVRENPEKLLPGAESAVVFAFSYYLKEDKKKEHLSVARYAQYKDYHKHLRRKAGGVLRNIQKYLEEKGKKTSGRIVIDSAPLLERALAAKTQRGFIGKNTLYIHPEMGSFLLLGEILLTEKLPYDHKEKVDPKKRQPQGGCGTCTRCQTHCPTGALQIPYQLDANLCLAYWSIEHRGVVPEKFWPHFKTYFFGCDICQNVCPYNRQKSEAEKDLRHLRAQNLDPYKVAVMNQAEYEEYFGGTPMTRAKISGLRRNALIVMAVMGHEKLEEALEKAELEGQEEVLVETAFQIRRYMAAPT